MTKSMLNADLLRNLVQIKAPSGYETDVLSFIQSKIDRLCDECRRDHIGNLIGIKYGKNYNTPADHPLLLDAHVDSVGGLISHLEVEPYRRAYITPIGKIDFQEPDEKIQRFSFLSNNPDNVAKSFPIRKGGYLDFTDEPEAEFMSLKIGDPGVLTPYFSYDSSQDLITGTYFDDRLGCYLLIQTLINLAALPQQENTLIFSFSVQEEIEVYGLRYVLSELGESTELKPTVALVIDCGNAIGINESNFTSEQYLYGVKYLHSGPILYRGPTICQEMSDKLVSLCEKNSREYQIRAVPHKVPNNLRVVFEYPSYIKGALIGIPVANMHSGLENASVKDLECAQSLIWQFIEEYNQK